MNPDEYGPFRVNPDEYGPFRVIPVGSCNVSLKLKSQWRNRDHWHTLWPEGGHWCYETEAEATARAEECTEIRASFRRELAGGA